MLGSTFKFAIDVFKEKWSKRENKKENMHQIVEEVKQDEVIE